MERLNQYLPRLVAKVILQEELEDPAGFRDGYPSYWRGQWHPTPVLLPGKSHGQRSLVGCRPWDCEESDTTEQLHFHFSL